MFDKIEIKKDFIAYFKNGKKLSLNMFDDYLLENKIYRVFFENTFLGLIKTKDNNLTYEVVY